MQQFEGTLIIVSHDRECLQNLTEKIYSFKDGNIKEYLGDIDYFLEQHNLENMREVEKRSLKENSLNKKNNIDGKKSYQVLKQKKQLQNKLGKIESEISKLEKDILNDDIEISENFEKVSSDKDFFNNYQAKKVQVDELMERWEEIHNKLEIL